MVERGQEHRGAERVDEYRRRVKGGLAAAKLVVAPTQAMLEDLERHYGENRQVASSPTAAVSASPCSAAKKPIIMAAGRLVDEAKNVMALDAAAAKVDWPVFVAGDTQHPGELGSVTTTTCGSWAACTRRPCPAGCRAPGCTPRRRAMSPLACAPLEAAYAGCALVLGDIPSQREVWGDAAAFVPPDDIDSSTSTLQRLTADERLRRVMAERAHARAQVFSGCRMLAQSSRGVLGAPHGGAHLGSASQPASTSARDRAWRRTETSESHNPGPSQATGDAGVYGEGAMRVVRLTNPPGSPHRNHGNAHFLRGIAAEAPGGAATRRVHQLKDNGLEQNEPRLAPHGDAALRAFKQAIQASPARPMTSRRPRQGARRRGPRPRARVE